MYLCISIYRDIERNHIQNAVCIMDININAKHQGPFTRYANTSYNQIISIMQCVVYNDLIVQRSSSINEKNRVGKITTFLIFCKVLISENTNITVSFPGTVADTYSQHR